MSVNEELDSISFNDSTTIERSEDQDSELYSTTQPTEAETTNSDLRNTRNRRRLNQTDEHHFPGTKNFRRDELEDDQMRRMLRESTRLHGETIERMPSEAVEDSKLDEEIRTVMEESKKTEEEYEREKQEEQIVIEYVKKLSLAEEFRKRMTSS